MRVFVTGATGFVGSAVVEELLSAGHKVLGLARSDTGAKSLAAAGAEVLRGELADIECLKRGAASTDGVIHTGFIHDFSNFVGACAVDQRAIETMGDALAGSGRPLIATAGLAGLSLGRASTEDDTPSDTGPRKSEQTALAQASKNVRAMVIRLSPSVHGDGDHGFVPMLINAARERGFSAYVGDGKNRWPGVHRFDAARLYRLALEKGASGARFHGVAEEGVPVRELAEVIARRLGVPAVSKTPQEAIELVTFVGRFLGMDAFASSAKTQQQLGWQPREIGLLADVEKGRYFDV